METIGKVRRRYFVMRLARNTVKKLIRAEPGEPQCRRRTQPQPQMGAYVESLEQMLAADSRLPKAQRRTAQRLFEALQLAGYQGAYDSVQRHVKQWRMLRPNPLSVFIPLAFAPGGLPVRLEP